MRFVPRWVLVFLQRRMVEAGGYSLRYGRQAAGLIELTLTVCRDLAHPPRILEIGSYMATPQASCWHARERVR